MHVYVATYADAQYLMEDAGLFPAQGGGEGDSYTLEGGLSVLETDTQSTDYSFTTHTTCESGCSTTSTASSAGGGGGTGDSTAGGVSGGTRRTHPPVAQPSVVPAVPTTPVTQPTAPSTAPHARPTKTPTVSSPEDMHEAAPAQPSPVTPGEAVSPALRVTHYLRDRIEQLRRAAPSQAQNALGVVTLGEVAVGIRLASILQVELAYAAIPAFGAASGSEAIGAGFGLLSVFGIHRRKRALA